MTDKKSSGLSEEDQCDLQQAWRLLGGEETGALSVKLLGTILRGFGRNPSEQEVQFLKYDNGLDDKSVLTYDEVLALYGKCTSHVTSIQDMIDAFKIFDSNNNGFLTLEELRDIMTRLGEPLSDDELEDLFRDADSTKEGKVFYEDFARQIMPNTTGSQNQ